MCGITGIARFDDQKIDESVLMQMTDALHYRGPDDSGVYINDNKSVALGHRRLSILDLSSFGHQPMSDKDEEIWVIHNGEIYNFLELKKELQTIGHTFFSSSDTEIIIKAYNEWREGGFAKLNGMFAFCIYDRKRDLLYLVRDHAGIKPLYYSISDKCLVFSSEVKSLKIFNRAWTANDDWQIYFLTFGHIPEPFTTLKNVFILPKGTFLCLDLKTKRHTLKKYASFEFSEKITSPDHAIQEVRNIFTKSIERHLLSDAPIGVFLSGGIDSSLIALIAHRFQKDNLRTLSVIFNEKDFSEETYQNIVLNKLRSKHRSYLVTEKDFIDSLDDIFQSMDQPTIDGINTYFIARCAKEEGLKSVLSGIGGDELFGGYPSFNRINKLWLLKKYLPGGFFKAFAYADSDRWKKLSFLSINNPLGYYLLFRGLYTPEVTAAILKIDIKDVEEALKKVYVKAPENIDKKNLVSYLETSLYMQNQLLKDTDCMSMRHSVEVRVPFLDKQLMDFLFSIHEQVKFNQNMSKYLLVKAFDDILPVEIVTRQKQGFTFPFDVWIRRNKIRGDALSERSINNNYREKLWNKFERGDLHWSRVWSCNVLDFYRNNETSLK